MALTPEVHALSRDQRADLERMTQEQITALVRAWVQAWDDLGPELEDAVAALLADFEAEGRVTAMNALRHKKLQDALKLAEDRIAELSEFMAETVSHGVDPAVKTGAFNEAELITAQLPDTADALALVQGFDRLPLEAMDAITLRTTERIHALSQPLSQSMQAALRAELVRGVSVGANPRVTARRIMDRTQGRFNGGLTRAMTIARTETLDAYRAGAQVADEGNADLLDAWIWTASLSGRTCAACIAKHGTEYPLDEPGPLGHQNCRCARTPKAKSWADLGFPGIPEVKSAVPDGEAWFNNLTPDSQRLLLGKGRYEAWKAGDFPMSQWAQLKHTEGWRDSWVVAPVPQPTN